MPRKLSSTTSAPRWETSIHTPPFGVPRPSETSMKHARATRFQARLSFDSDAVRLELRDNGKGFVVDSANGGGIGLIGMRERAEQIGATLAVTSKPARGTKIIAVSPYQQPVLK